MKRSPIRRARRPLWVTVLYLAVLGSVGSMPIALAQVPTQTAQPTQQPVTKGRRTTSTRPPVQPPQTDETKGTPDAANEAPKEAEPAQPQTPLQPFPQRPTRPTPGKEVEPSGDSAVRPTTSDSVPEPARGAGAQPQPQPPPTAEMPKKPDESEMDPAKRAEEARRAAAERAAARRNRTGQGGDATGKPISGQPGSGATGFPSPQPPMPMTQPSGEAMGEVPPDGVPSTAINIAPAESDVPPEARMYGFSIKDGTYEQLIEGFARQTGLGVIGDAPKDGKVTFVSTETLTFDQALGRVQMLLFKYKPHEPYWIVRNEMNLEVSKVNDLYRVLPRNRMFRSVEELLAANLSRDELALVVYTPKTGSVADLKQVRDWLPDYVRVTPLEDQNSVTIFALFSDIEKYLGLIDFIRGTRSDPRTLEKIEVHHLLASEALNRLRQLMDIDGGAPQGRPAAATPRRVAREPSALDSMPEPPVTVIADDAQGILLVRAMQDKIDEIRLLLPYIDVDLSAQSPAPVIVKLQYVEASEMIAILQQILSASGAPPGTPATPKPKKTKRGVSAPAGTPPAATTGSSGAASGSENITLLSHPSDNAIIVLADEDGVARVRELVTLFDVSSTMDPVRLPLSHADANEVLNTVTAVLGAGATGKKGQPALDRFTLVVDPAGDAVWFRGGDKDLAKVKGLIETIDVAEEPVSLRVVHLKYQQPTFVSNMLREFDGSAALSPTPAPAGRKPKSKRATSVQTSKFTADDTTNRLFIICTEDEWARYQPLIAQLDRPAEDGEVFVRLPLQHADPNTAIERLGALVDEEGVRFIASEGSILAVGAKPQQLERIKVFIAEVDKPSQVEQRTFEIRHANPADIKSAIESLIADMPVKTPRRPRKGDAGKGVVGTEATVSDHLTIVQLGQRLVVQTTSTRMEQVAALVAEFDVEETKTELKVYSDFPTGTNIESISETVSSVFTAAGRGPKRGNKDGTAEGPRFIPQPASGRLVVIAEPTLFPEIERLLTVLRHEVESRPTVVAFVDVKHADPTDLVESIKPLLDIKIRGLLESGELDEAGEESVAAPKTTKRRSVPVQTSSERYHLSPDSRNHRIVIAAPQVVVDQAKALIAQFDTPGETLVFKTVELANASPDEMVRAVKEMMGRPVARKVTGKGKAGATPTVDLGSGDGLSVVEAPGGGAVILHGQAAEVAQAEDWIKQLDAMSSRGRTIKVYEIKKADMTKLFDLIVHVMGSSPPASGGKGGQRSPRGAAGKGSDSKEDAEEEFTTTKTFAGADLYIQADLIGKTMLVATTPSKVSEIDDIVTRLDKNESDPGGIGTVMGKDKPVAKLTYDLKYADSIDAKYALKDAFETMWEPRDEVPQVDGFGSVLIVRYPHEERFDEIRELIRKYADKPDEKKTKVVAKSFPAPAGLSAQEAADWIKMNHPEIAVDLKNITPGSDKSYDIVRIRPPAPKKSNPCAMPGAFLRATDALLGSIVGQSPPKNGAVGQPEAQPLPEEEATEDEPEEEVAPMPTGDDMIRRAVAPIAPRKSSKKTAEPQADDKSKTAEKPSDKSAEKTDDKKRLTGERIDIDYDNVAGVFVVKGRAGDVKEVDDWLEELKEGIEDFPVKPDIRIYQVSYIDVYSAQDILEEMFNATKQQTAMLQQQQQQAIRAQQQLQQRQGQGQQPGAKGQPGDQAGPGGPGGQAARLAQQQALQAQLATPQLPQAGVRIYPNPRDRTLILRAETSQYPQIEELLATIDQPKPIDSFMRTYPLKNLNATEVEEILREMLDMGKDGARPKGGAARTPGVPGLAGPSSAPSGQLPQTILQETVSGASQLGVDPADIKLFSSEVSNTVMAMAPKKALDFIGDLIKKLESEDIPQRTTKYYELKHADVEDAAAYLESHFEEASGPRKPRKGGGDAAAAGPGGRSLNTPSFVPYPRLNMLTVQATAAQIEEIDKIVERIDVSGGMDKWEDVVLAYSDAKMVADTLTSMFVEKSGGGTGPKATPQRAANPKFIGEAGGGIVLFSAPPSLREQILTTIAKLEEQYKVTRTPRIIELKNAKPSALAEAIEKAYDAKKAGTKSGGSIPPRFTITAHDPTKRLFVIADDETFKEVESLAKLLDDKPGGIGVEFRIYPMQYASAKVVHGQLTKLMKDYVTRLGQGDKTIEAFSVEPDELSNSLIVLGGPTVFGFIEENLRKVDTPASKSSQPASLIVPLSNANAAEVAANIQKLYGAKEQPLGMTAPQVEANPSTNTLIVRGTQAQIDEIKKDIIDPLEAQIAGKNQVQVKPIKLTFADPGSVQDAVNKLFRSESRNARDQVSAVPEYTSNSVIVSASPENLKRVEALIAQIDNAETSQQDVHVVEIKHADAASVAQTLTEIFVRAGAKQIGNQAPPITISAVAGSRALLIKCKAEDFVRIAETIKELDTEVVGTGGEVRVVTLLYGDAAEINTAMQEYLRRPSGAGGRGSDLVGGVRLSAMAQSNSLMVSGAKEEVDRLESIIHGMDVAGEKGSVPQIIPLKYANVGMILPSVQEVFTEIRGGGRRNQPAPVIVADEGSNALIVRASPTDLTAIQGIVAQLDTEDKKDKTPYRVVQVKAGINVTDLAEQVETTINESAQAWSSGSRGARVQSVTVTPNVRTNSLVIAGYAPLFDQAEALAKKLEEMGPSGNVSTRIVKVGNIKVDQVQKLIDQLTQQPGGQGQRGGGGRPRPASRPRSGP